MELSNRKTVGVTGANGYIGANLVTTLVERDYKVNMLSRTGNRGNENNLISYQHDLTSGLPCPKEFFEGVSIIFNCAGNIMHEDKMRKLHVEGTKSLIEGARRETRRRGDSMHIVQLSSAGVYGPNPHGALSERLITEDSPLRPRGEYETTKAESDTLFKSLDGSDGITYSILRPTIVFSRDMPNSSLRILAKMIKKGWYYNIGAPGAIANYVHVNDVVDALIMCANVQKSRGQVYIISNDCPFEDIVSSLASYQNVNIPKTRLPYGLVKLLVSVFSIFSQFPLNQSRLDAMTGRSHYSSNKIERHLGFVAQKDVALSIKEIVR